MDYPFDPALLDPPGVVIMPEPLDSVERAQIRQMQAEIIAAQPNTFAGASTVQYTPVDYRFEAGIGQIHFSADTAVSIGADLAASVQAQFGAYPITSPLSTSHDDYWFIGELWPDPEGDGVPVNKATMDFYERFFALLKARDFKFVNSVAYEILNFFMPESWKQRNFLGNPALSGWYPPSSFIQPTSFDALNYISRVQVQVLDAAVAAGLDPYFQIGEPWWWDGSYSTGAEKNAPCMYDQRTMDLYKAETGNDVPTPRIVSIFDPVAENQWPYVDWLCVKLGESTNYIRDKVKETYPDADATLLFFSPQVMSPASELTYRLNFPIQEWVYPNYEFVQIEDYDWIIDGRLDLVPKTFDAALNLLGYPLETIHYFIGFVLLAENKYIWNNCDKAIGLALEAEIPQQYLWSYTQVMRDSVIFRRPKICGC